MKILILLGVVVLAVLLLFRVILSIVRSVVAHREAGTAQQLRDFQDAMGEARRKLQEARSEEARQKRRADELFDIILGVEGERDLWQKLYREQAHGASVAQAWLFRSLSDSIQIANARAEQLKALGRPVPDVVIDPKSRELLQEFTAVHPEKAGAAVPHAPGFEKAQQVQAAFEAEGSELPTAQKGAVG